MRHLKEEHIAVTRKDGGLSVMSIIVQAPLSAFAPDAAIALGFNIETVDGEEVWSGGITDEGVEAELARTTWADGVSLLDVTASWRRITDDEATERRNLGGFRNAVRDTGKKLAVDMPAARDLARTMIRGMRPGMFANLDNAMKPLEVRAALGTITAQEKSALVALEAQRQDLRDAPADPRLDGAKTVAELVEIISGVGA